MKTPERPQWRYSAVFVINFEHILPVNIYIFHLVNIFYFEQTFSSVSILFSIGKC